MKTKLFTLLLAISACTAANAQFGGLGGSLGGSLGGLLGGGGSSAASADAGSMIDQFNKESDLISGAVSYSLIQIVAALGDKTQIAAVKALNDNLAQATDPKEQGSVRGTVIKEQSAVAQELLKSKEAKAKMEQLSPEMKKKVGQSLMAVGIASLRLPGLVDKGKGIVAGVGANPMHLGKLPSVQTGLSMLGDAMPKLPTIVTTGFKLMRDVKLDPGTPTADAKLEIDNNVKFPD